MEMANNLLSRQALLDKLKELERKKAEIEIEQRQIEELLLSTGVDSSANNRNQTPTSLLNSDSNSNGNRLYSIREDVSANISYVIFADGSCINNGPGGCMTCLFLVVFLFFFILTAFVSLIVAAVIRKFEDSTLKEEIEVAGYSEEKVIGL